MGGLLCSDLEEELEGILRTGLDERLPSEARSLLIRLQYKSGVALSALFPGHVTMAPGLYRVMSASVLLLHAAYIAWVIFGAFFTRGRPRLATLHVATLVYGMVIEVFGFWCPLTALETWFEVRGNVPAYRGSFLLHYLDAVVYPNIPPNLLIAGAVAVCILNLWTYARRFRARHSLDRSHRDLWECG